jgi:hypothetical protein
MSEGVGLVVGAFVVRIDFLMPFKTHQWMLPRSGVLVFAVRWKKRGLRMPYKRRSAGRPTWGMVLF